jgi:hypothetical protein
MSEEIEQQTESKEVQESKVEVQEPKTEVERKEDTVQFIKEFQKNQDTSEQEVDSGEVVVGDSDEVESEVLEGLEDTDIPDEFSEAAEAAGLSMEEIIKIANKNTDEQLMELVPILQDAIKEPEEIDEEKEIKGEQKQTETSELEKEVVERIEKQLAEKFKVSLDEIEKYKNERITEQKTRDFDFAMDKIDKVAKKFPVFGKMSELPRFESGALKGQLIPTHPAVKARIELAGYADAFIGMGQSVADAMDNAIATYAGKHLTKEIERNYVKTLKKNESNLSGPRSGKVTRKTFSDAREETLDYIRQQQRARGVDV